MTQSAMDAVTFSQDELMDIREQYMTRIGKLERQNEELELMLRRALSQVRAVEEIMRRAVADTAEFEDLLVKMVDECDILADEELPRPKQKVAQPHALPKVIISDMPRTVTPAVPMRSPRSVFTAEVAAGSVTLPPAPPPVSPQEVSDDMVVEESGLTVVAAKVPLPLPPLLSSPMPGAPRGALHALVARAQKNAPSRRHVS